MSRLEELIVELCPNGVEYKTLGEVLSYEQPTKYLVSNTTYNDAFTIPVLTAGKTFILGYTNEKNGIYNASKKNPVIIFDDFTTSIKWVDFNFKIKSSAIKILKEKNNYNLRYIFYCMESIKYSTMDHTRQWIEKYSKFTIAFPPLPIQKEIVRILDNFSELTAELTAELTKRKQQYQYYRDLLLTFEERERERENTKTLENNLQLYLRKLCPNGIEYITLSDLFNIKNGYTPSKAKNDFWENGTIPWFRMEDIRKNGRILSNALQHVSNKAIKGTIFPAYSIIVATSATIGEHALITVPFLANQRLTCLIIKEQYKLNFNMKFLYYYCFKLDAYCLTCLNHGNFASVDMVKFSKFKIPVPPLPVQEEIVRILDRFAALCHDLTSGLPAEIAARKKQYEYYRDKLLTFKEAV